MRGRLFSRVRRFAFVLSLILASCALFSACKTTDSAGTIPRSNVRAPRAAYRLDVFHPMLFAVGENPLEQKTVNIPVGEYVFEGEDDIFLYFRSPEEMEYRVYHKEGYAEGVFQMGGLALARKEQWDKVEYPACTYIASTRNASPALWNRHSSLRSAARTGKAISTKAPNNAPSERLRISPHPLPPLPVKKKGA